MRYKSGYKYQIVEDVHFPDTGILPALGRGFDHDWIALSNEGYLIVRKGYAFDGPSGPTFDTKNFMRGSLAHDALYQLMGDGTIDISYREKADKYLVQVCKEDGMSAIRRAWVYAGVRVGGARAASKPDKILTAP